MNIIDIIQKDIPDFSGICLREGDASIEKVRDLKISLAWKMNVHRARIYKKVLIVGNNSSKGKYFIADIISILSVREVFDSGLREEGIKYQEEIYGKWITQRINGVIEDNALQERFAILFENPTEIKKFSNNFSFNRTSLYYINSNKDSNIKSKMYLGEHIEISNIGKINNAKIKINGLTVIAGVNDTGKSTTGKILFSIIKATSRYKQDLKEGKEFICLNKIERLYTLLRRSNKITNIDFLREDFYPRNFLNQINKISENIIQASFNDSIDNESISQVNDFISGKKILLKKYTDENNLKILSQILDEIKEAILSEDDKELQITRALGRALFSEFTSDITPKGSTKKSHIKYFAGEMNLLDVELKDNAITKLKFTEDLSFRDVVFIETPLLIQMYDLIKNSDAMFEDEENSHSTIYRNRSKVSLHIKDLIDKVENAKYYSNSFYENDFDSVEILKNISSIIKGGYTFDKEGRELMFTNTNGKKNSYQVKAVNTASGIKSFGIIQLLLQANILNDRSLLIIDEPENHLHPEWQIKYAEMIIELIKFEIPVIVTSHSPYMIQALKFFSERNDLKEKSNYYYAKMEKDDEQSNLMDVTDNLNIIFSTLAEPLKDLVWR